VIDPATHTLTLTPIREYYIAHGDLPNSAFWERWGLTGEEVEAIIAEARGMGMVETRKGVWEWVNAGC
jgi:hypothetical protein